ncbi:TRAP transporter large permease [Pusillimonas sp. ANT_WB101]|uniref:TRAP transporter large permease n=1 Tax=Pusillimonas sp. ANT_WB101 TaxID=2597356 RepID=UPI0011EE726A|nr:TRAP transporter large permease [Pusillimonas sp. ANT_WB101]KAA0890866.1 TRAP transporter large permease [Pusillimonas sp. ANT_WB101]
MTAFLIIVLLFGLLALGVPVGFAMGVAGTIGLFIVGNWDMVLGVLQTTPLSTVSTYELITIPMFLLMAELVLKSGIADDLFRAAAAWVGHIRGGLGMATAMAGAGFGAICGTSTASAATLSATSLPAMLRHGYEPKMASGVVAISGTLAMLIPPSIVLIIYGLLAEANIGKLLIAGIIPGILITITIIATVYVLAVRNPAAAPVSPRVSLRDKISLLRVIGPMIVLMMMVTGVIYTGVATPTEASALGAFGALLIAILRGKARPAEVMDAAKRAAQGTCMIAMILLGAHIFGYFFTLTMVTQNLVQWVGAMDASPWVVMVAILLVYVILGAFMDQLAILVLTVPIVLPLVVALGFDPIWFGVIVIVTAEVGLITPPMGLNCFVVAFYAKRPVSEVFAGIWPHVFAHFIAIGLMLAFPQIILWLPSMMK